MKTFKIIDLPNVNGTEQVFIGLNRNNEGEDFLEIRSYHNDGSESYIHSETADSDSVEVLLSVIKNFQYEDAEEFAKRYTM